MLQGALSVAVFSLVAVGCDGKSPVAPTGPPVASFSISPTGTGNGYADRVYVQLTCPQG